MADTEVKELLTALRSSMDKNHESLSGKIDLINDRIDESNQAITTEIRNLEDRVFTEIRQVRDSQDQQQRLIDFNKQLMDREVNQLKLELKSKCDQLSAQEDKIVRLERACHGGLQHNRGWCIEVDGIPANVGDDPVQLERAFIHICNKINVMVDQYDVDTVHRLPSDRSPKPTIVRFNSRKVVRDLHENRSKLKDLEELDLDIPGLHRDSKIFIRTSQSPYTKNLAYNCRLLKRSNEIAQVITGKDGRLTIKTLHGEFVKIGHEQDLKNKFPDFPNFSFNVRDTTE